MALLLHIILAILKILGILVLLVLCLILLLLLILLFVPVTYQMYGRKAEGELQGSAGVTWLFGLLAARVSWRDGSPEIELRLLGMPADKWKEKFKGRKKPDSRQPSGSGDPEENHIGNHTENHVKNHTETLREPPKTVAGETGHAKQAQRTVQTQPDVCSQQGTAGSGEMAGEKKRLLLFRKWDEVRRRMRDLFRRIAGIPDEIRRSFRNVRLTFRKICDTITHWKNFFSDETTKDAIMAVRKVSGRLLRHMMPKKAVGYLKFGFDDPATTGQLLGILCLVPSLYTGEFVVVPVFEEKIFECEIRLQGRIFGCVLLKAGIQIASRKSVWTTVQRFREREA